MCWVNSRLSVIELGEVRVVCGFSSVRGSVSRPPGCSRVGFIPYMTGAPGPCLAARGDITKACCMSVGKGRTEGVVLRQAVVR